MDPPVVQEAVVEMDVEPVTSPGTSIAPPPQQVVPIAPEPTPAVHLDPVPVQPASMQPPALVLAKPASRPPPTPLVPTTAPVHQLASLPPDPQSMHPNEASRRFNLYKVNCVLALNVDLIK